MTASEDPFDSLLGLEDDLYNEGYDLGVKDGKCVGLSEGRLFGLEKGFEKYITMGRLHGRAVLWSGKLACDRKENVAAFREDSADLRPNTTTAPLENARLKTHIRTLYALTEPDSLSTENSENSVADFDDRLKRAEGKLKIIEKLTGENYQGDQRNSANKGARSRGDGGIEDTSILSVRH